MKKDIILSGVGGQGILSIAAVIGQAALKDGLYLKQAEVHGMSQRGGDVQSNLRLSDRPIASDLIPTGKCDLIISLEPMEALRYLPYLSPEGWLVTNAVPFVNIPNYPAEEAVTTEIDRLLCQYPQLSGGRSCHDRNRPPLAPHPAGRESGSQGHWQPARGQHRVAGSHSPLSGHWLRQDTRQHP